MKHEEIMTGEITVVGKNFFQIELRKGMPDTVLVEFQNEPNYVPCNPSHDKLQWELHDRHHGFVLVIKWDVTSARRIIWAASYV